MKVSAHRYRQSRQGATVTSSKWMMPVVALVIVGVSVVFLTLFHLLQAPH